MAEEKKRSASERISDRFKGAVSDRLKGAVKQAVDRDLARARLGTRLIAAGLALLFLGGGLDYFEAGDMVRGVVREYAQDSGQTGVVEAVDKVESLETRGRQGLGLQEDWKEQVRRDVAILLPILVVGLGLIGAGLRLKLGVPGASRGVILRDTGRLLAIPGFVGFVAITLHRWREAVVNETARSFWNKFWDDEISSDAFWYLVKNYAGWPWRKLSAFLVLGAVFVSIGLVGAWFRSRFDGPSGFVFDLTRRTAFWGGAICLGFYGLATLVAVFSYGSALRVFEKPWDDDPTSFVVTILLFAIGVGMARSGTALRRREGAEAAAAA